jgi:hypothetical protein
MVFRAAWRCEPAEYITEATGNNSPSVMAAIADRENKIDPGDT